MKLARLGSFNAAKYRLWWCWVVAALAAFQTIADAQQVWTNLWAIPTGMNAMWRCASQLLINSNIIIMAFIIDHRYARALPLRPLPRHHRRRRRRRRQLLRGLQ